jgi:hypothetical protein
MAGKPAWLSAFGVVCVRLLSTLNYAGGLEVPSSNLGAPTEGAPRPAGLFVLSDAA